MNNHKPHNTNNIRPSMDSMSCSSNRSDDDSDSSSRETHSSTDDSSSTTSPKRHNNCDWSDHVSPDTEYAERVQKWALKIPIRLGLCPWAAKAHSQGRLRYVTYEGTALADVAKLISSETALLDGENVPPLSSTLVVCPHIAEWIEFQPFDDFVGSGLLVDGIVDHKIQEKYTFVAFHPKFLRWYALPTQLRVGSAVKSHWGMIGRKSVGETAAATIVETENRAFGRRKAKVRFDEELEGRRQEQYVPIEWIDHPFSSGEPLPDNVIHQAPFPTIHIIANRDLASLSIRDISRVKRQNACKMVKLGWSGIGKQLSDL